MDRKRISKVRIKVDWPKEKKTTTGIILPAEGTNVRKGLATERVDGEWWPESGIVMDSYNGMFKHGFHETGEEAWSPDSLTYVRKVDHTYHTWRLPMPGETAYFGYKDMNPRGKEILVLDDGSILVEMARAYAVRGLDGELRGNGQWCVVEQIPEDVDSGPLITKIRIEDGLGIGVVRLAGDGFSSKLPSVKRGMVLKFKVSGSNPIVPNPDGGAPMVRILAEWVVGIDESGMSDAELDGRKSAAAGHGEIIRQALASVGNIKVEDEMDIARRQQAEVKDASWADSRKKRDKMALGSKRKLY